MLIFGLDFAVLRIQNSHLRRSVNEKRDSVKVISAELTRVHLLYFIFLLSFCLVISQMDPQITCHSFASYIYFTIKLFLIVKPFGCQQQVCLSSGPIGNILYNTVYVVCGSVASCRSADARVSFCNVSLMMRRWQFLPGGCCCRQFGEHWCVILFTGFLPIFG